MSSCNLDHDLEDVTKKLSEQKPYLPEDLFVGSNQLLEKRPDQNTLNELFHLLKKYDLASEEERAERNTGIRKLTSK
ncbi:group-specific protein [Sporosarcina jiandibaonis]|uniref:group-specific protein n=1 Tax=Sporosarcina jiandibaonis TaxID=2715535 RepID=UPI00155217E7|nr:group-specific protein [Sporosarcina jiandibaonis]